MNPKEWLSLATRFDLGICKIYKRKVLIEARDQMDESRLWVVYMDGWVLGKNGEWYYELLPSARTDEFIRLTRFSFAGVAYEAWRALVTESKPLIL